MSTAWFVTIFLAVWPVELVSADDGDDFSNNLFTDLAPLLALFGERVTMQFMSQSMGWADNIILAMAPIGIITVIISAIRVGGPAWLKAIIGRARENLAVAETELMSSTSREACELWNGMKIVRSMGAAPISEFICLLPETDATNDRDGPDVVVKTMGDAVKGEHLNKLDIGIDINRMTSGDSKAEQGQAPANNRDPNVIITQNLDVEAPNLSLNVHSQFDRRELHSVAVVAILLQVGVLIYSGFATYHRSLKFQKKTHPVEDYAFPCTSVGTCLLVTGMLICSHVVESSTTETKYRPGHGRKARIVWLQKSQTVNDQFFDSFSIWASDERTIITTSQRTDKSSEAVLELKTVIGSGISLCGYVVQFIGLRGMHWSVSVVQLGAIVIMAILRTWVRRGLSQHPICQPLAPGYELDWFAMTAGDIRNAPWRHVATVMPDWSIRSHGEYDKIQQWKLGELADWRGPATTEAIALANAIEIVMDSLFDTYEDGSYGWSLTTRDKQIVTFRLDRRSDGRWKAYSDEIEAALSLWLFSVYQVEHEEYSRRTLHDRDDTWLRSKDPTAAPGLRVLGLSGRDLHRDLWWWMPREANRIMELKEDEQGGLEVEKHRIVGHMSHQVVATQARYKTSNLSEPSFEHASDIVDATDRFLVARVHTPLKLLYAQEIFSAFVWTVAKMLKDPIPGDCEVHHLKTDKRPGDWQHFTLQNAQPSEVAQSIQKTGLGNLEDIYQCLIPPLSLERKLPQLNSVVSLGRQQARRHELMQHWEEASDVYIWLFQLAQKYPASSHVATKTTAVLVEFSRSIYQVMSMMYMQKDVGRLSKVYSSLKSKIQTDNRVTIAHIWKLYEQQDRSWSHVSGVEMESIRSNDNGYPPQFNHTKLHGAAQSSDRWDLRPHRGIRKDVDVRRSVDERDIHDWTPLHYATAKGIYLAVVSLIRNGANVNAQDLLEWTPLHYACKYGDIPIVRHLIREGAGINTRGRNGVAPIHCAAKSKHLDAKDLVTFLIEAGAAVDVVDSSGCTPFEWAAYMGHRGAADALWSTTNTNIRKHRGRMALHFAMVSGDEDFLTWLVQKTRSHIGGKGVDDLTALHIAAATGNEKMVSWYLKDWSDINKKDRRYWTPLQYACHFRNIPMVKLLISKGADKNCHSENGWTPLHYATREYDSDLIALLIQNQATKDSRDRYEMNPLHHASIIDNAAVVKLLHQKGATINIKNVFGSTALHFACMNGDTGMAEMLINQGAYQDAKDCHNRTPLHYAALHGHADLYTLLITRGADKNMEDAFQRTPEYYTTLNCDAGFPQPDMPLAATLSENTAYIDGTAVELNLQEDIVLRSCNIATINSTRKACTLFNVQCDTINASGSIFSLFDTSVGTINGDGNVIKMCGSSAHINSTMGHLDLLDSNVTINGTGNFARARTSNIHINSEGSHLQAFDSNVVLDGAANFARVRDSNIEINSRGNYVVAWESNVSSQLIIV